VQDAPGRAAASGEQSPGAQAQPFGYRNACLGEYLGELRPR
jgi:hypothetical protein